MDRGVVTRGADWHALTLVTLGLVAFGIVMVYSATSGSAAVGGGDPMEYLARQATFAVIGLVGMLGITRIDYRRLRLVAPALLVTSLAACAAVLVLGDPVNGARRWLGFGPASFQPSEVAKLALALWLAAHLAKRPAPRTLKELWRPIGMVVGLFAVLILLEPDLGTSITIALMVAAVLLVSGTPAVTLGAAATVAGGLALLAVWVEPYRRERLLSFLNPWSDAQGSGFQTIQAQIGLGSGGFLGEGLGQGVQKIHYLPEAHTDMILAVIGEELGLLGTGLVILAYAAFAWAGLTVALRCRDPLGKRLAAALTALVCGQATVNLAAVLGLAPLTGIPLPFVSYGGSSLVVQLVAVGVLLNIAASGKRRAHLRDRGRGNGGTRAAGARGRGRAEEPRRASDLRRVAGPRRSATGS